MAVIESNTKPANPPFNAVNPSGIDPGQSLQVLNEVKQGEEQRRLEREKMAMESAHKSADRAAQMQESSKNREAETGIAQQRMQSDQMMEQQRLQNQQQLQEKHLQFEAEQAEIDRKNHEKEVRLQNQLALIDMEGQDDATGAALDAVEKRKRIEQARKELEEHRTNTAAYHLVSGAIAGKFTNTALQEMAQRTSEATQAKLAQTMGLLPKLREAVTQTGRGKKGETVKNEDGSYDSISAEAKAKGYRIGKDETGVYMEDPATGRKKYKATGLAGSLNKMHLGGVNDAVGGFGLGDKVMEAVKYAGSGNIPDSFSYEGGVSSVQGATLGLDVEQLSNVLTEGTNIPPAQFGALLTLAEKAKNSGKPEDKEEVRRQMKAMVGKDTGLRKDLAMRMTMAQKLAHGHEALLKTQATDTNAERMGGGEKPINFSVEAGTEPFSNALGTSTSIADIVDMLGNMKDDDNTQLLSGYGGGVITYGRGELSPDLVEAKALSKALQALSGHEDLPSLVEALTTGKKGVDELMPGLFNGWSAKAKDDLVHMLELTAHNVMLELGKQEEVRRGVETVREKGGLSSYRQELDELVKTASPYRDIDADKEGSMAVHEAKKKTNAKKRALLEKEMSE